MSDSFRRTPAVEVPVVSIEPGGVALTKSEVSAFREIWSKTLDGIGGKPLHMHDRDKQLVRVIGLLGPILRRTLPPVAPIGSWVTFSDSNAIQFADNQFTGLVVFVNKVDDGIHVAVPGFPVLFKLRPGDYMRAEMPAWAAL
jgi:hypothetical protein